MHYNVDIEIDDLNGTLEEAFLAVLPAKEKIHQFDLNSDSSRQDPTGIIGAGPPNISPINPLTTRRPFEVRISDLINLRNSGNLSDTVNSSNDQYSNNTVINTRKRIINTIVNHH
jgi:hypothetical protein